MRPRVFPAEDDVYDLDGTVPDRASMRPRVFPAEDVAASPNVRRICRCFNEAAGIPRGRRGPQWRAIVGNGRFNEAAGIPRGRLHDGAAGVKSRSSFNEAAGIPRGRQPAIGQCKIGMAASMRPRVFPAED